MSRIGRKARLNGVYWKSGLYIYEETLSSHGVVTIDSNDEFCGSVIVQTQGRQAETFCSDLVDLVFKVAEEFGFTPSTPRPDRNEKQILVDEKIEKFKKEDAVETKHKYTQALPSNYSQELFVSYSWVNTEHPTYEEDVNRLCQEAETRGIKIWRDKNDLGLGESIETFMNQLADSRRIFVFLSKKYLESEFCMYELYNIWLRSKSDPEIFQNRVKVYNIDAEIFTIPERIKVARHWKNEYDAYQKIAKEDFDILGKSTFQKVQLVKRFALETDEILSIIADKVQPQSFDAFLKHGFDSLE